VLEAALGRVGPPQRQDEAIEQHRPVIRLSRHRRGKYHYGDSQLDIQDELLRYSKANRYPAVHYANVLCMCGSTVFSLLVDDDEGATVRKCVSCHSEHALGDSDQYLEDAELEECECPCGSGNFEITAGVALYLDSEDVKWLYIGCRCVKCGLTACYADWKNETIGFRELLSRI
jgi:hypothetical protein